MEIQRRSAWNYGGRLMTGKQALSCIRTSAGFYPTESCSSCARRLDFHLLLLMLLDAIAQSSTLSTCDILAVEN